MAVMIYSLHMHGVAIIAIKEANSRSKCMHYLSCRLLMMILEYMESLTTRFQGLELATGCLMWPWNSLLPHVAMEQSVSTCALSCIPTKQGRSQEPTKLVIITTTTTIAKHIPSL